MSVLKEEHYWLEVDPETMLPTGRARLVGYYGDSDKPTSGFWVLVKRVG